MQGWVTPKTCEEKSTEPLRSESALATAFETVIFGICWASENISRLFHRLLENSESHTCAVLFHFSGWCCYE